MKKPAPVKIITKPAQKVAKAVKKLTKMNKIASFQIDHRILSPGLYLSRRDGDVDTYDIRFKKPNAGAYLSNLELHSVEHTAATVLRNSEIADRVVYFGPMGCRTGFYLLVRGVDGETVKKELDRAFRFIVDECDEMYGQSPVECGNYRELSLDAAKQCIAAYLSEVDVLSQTLKYPESEEKA